MPIRAENKDLYPREWPEIRAKIRARAGDRCENCGVVNRSRINRFTREICLHDEENTIRVVCTTAHLDHDPRNCSDENLRFWCQRCHNRYDRKHRDQTIRTRKMKDQLKLSI